MCLRLHTHTFVHLCIVPFTHTFQAEPSRTMDHKCYMTKCWHSKENFISKAIKKNNENNKNGETTSSWRICLRRFLLLFLAWLPPVQCTGTSQCTLIDKLILSFVIHFHFKFDIYFFFFIAFVRFCFFNNFHFQDIPTWYSILH